jgi:hypothetical protein
VVAKTLRVETESRQHALSPSNGGSWQTGRLGLLTIGV